MNLTLIGCPFRNFYSGMYIDALRQALVRSGVGPTQWVAAHCGCEDPVGLGRIFQTEDCSYFELRQIKLYRSSNAFKRNLRLSLRELFYRRHAARYAALSAGADVVHFHQIANAFGSDVVFSWLRQKSAPKRVVTVHELDDEQLEFTRRNAVYNRADALIVHCEDMKRQLVGLGVRADLISIIPHGTPIGALEDVGPREGIVYYGGHRLMQGKNIAAMFEAYALLWGRLGPRTPRLRIHGQWGPETPSEGIVLAERAGISAQIDWLNTLEADAVSQLYQRSLMAVLPYSTSFAGWPIGFVAANGLPVIATRAGGIPDHIGDLGVWVKGDDASELAQSMEDLFLDPARRATLGAGLRARALEVLDWERVARATSAVYQRVLQGAAAG
jgi:glycosyltransferase involved in cell wall biosynthesis